ncbi:hypothetical protein [Streptomyces malaysiense]|uniref:Uncharacterized protein n=1 Tax=Streptomyces malaysiense TaxID=1428626 RepID=A0A1J4PZR0_9ACTN|nr:hypothetical protein [Streptomyces malaysiense]OIK25439.1 hypothetical protein VT52_021430 [Streptomyces malaysiense]
MRGGRFFLLFVLFVAAAVWLAALPATAAAEHPRLPALPIPGDPRAAHLEPFTGHAVVADPVDAPAVPRHPFMAPNGTSNLHDDAYQTDTYAQEGPAGHGLTVRTRLQGGLCGSVTFDSRGRLVTVCLAPGRAPRLMLLDPGDLHTIASMKLPGTVGTSTTDVTGGGYFYLDDKDRVVVPTKTGDVQIVAVKGNSFVTQRSYDLKPVIGTAGIVSALPDWSGLLWFVTGSGVVGTLDLATGVVRSQTLRGEQIANSIAVDESGGVFVVSDHALYRFDAGAEGAPQVTWRAVYDRGTRRKPGQFDRGSGTTPTLIGPASGPGGGYVAITDNADPRMHVLVMARGKAGPAKVCSEPVFPAWRGADENGLIAVDGDLIAENNYGYTADGKTLLKGLLGKRTSDTVPGVVRVHVDYARRSCTIAWSNTTERIPSVVSKVALGNGLLYTYTHPSAAELAFKPKEHSAGTPDAWYLTALDVRTGKRAWSRLAGAGPLFNNHYAPVSIGADGSAYVGCVGGLLRITDS